MRFADGFVFQHLVERPVTIGALPERRVDAANRPLNEVAAELGADAAVRSRRLRAPR